MLDQMLSSFHLGISLNLVNFQRKNTLPRIQYTLMLKQLNSSHQDMISVLVPQLCNNSQLGK
jgi:hypothetical protein